MKNIWLFLSLISLPSLLFSQEIPLKTRIYLIGDAGEMENESHPVIEDLNGRLKSEKASQTHLIYLGDNIYPFGMPDINDESRVESENILKKQLGIWPSLSGNIYMIPGNHDWEKGKSDGWNSVLRAQEYVEENFPNGKVNWLPKDACPGPFPVYLNDETVLIVLDSQWWLHNQEKPGEDSDCEFKTEEEIISILTYLLEENQDKIVLIAMHHPMRAFGPHNGGFNWKDHLFPLRPLSSDLYIPIPILGSIYPLYRTWFGDVQDIPHPRYQAMIGALDRVFALHPHVIQVSGHEHGLFYTKEEGKHYVVSGAGAKNTHIRKVNTAEFTYADQGYAYLDFYENHRVTLNFLAPGRDSSLLR